MQLLINLKKVNDKYKRNKTVYAIGILGSVATLAMIIFGILNLSGFYDKQINTTERLMLPDPLEQSRKTKRQLQDDLREDRIVSNREIGSTLDANYGDTLVDTDSKIIVTSPGSTESNLYSELGPTTNNNQENAKKIADNILGVTNTRDEKLKTLSAEQQKEATIEKLKEELAKTTLEKNLAQNKLKIHESINGTGNNYGNNTRTGNTTGSNHSAMQGQSSANVAGVEAYGPYSQVGQAVNAAMHNGTIKTLSNGHIITEDGKISEAYTRQAGQGYITSTAKPQSVATRRNTIPAIVDRDHTLYSGSLLQIRLLKDVNLSGIVVPLNYYVYGIVKFAKERIYVDFKTIELNNSIVDFKAVVYDYDGLLGLDAPGTVATDIAKNASAQAIEGTNASVSGDAESILGNATAAVTKSAVNAVKSLSSIKILEQKVNIKAGHKLFLVF
ncbi:MAG: conjugative transposon protein TraM [Solitalea-like symbiont of Acarus siro]